MNIISNVFVIQYRMKTRLAIDGQHNIEAQKTTIRQGGPYVATSLNKKFT